MTADALAFFAGAALSLAASALLVTRLERIGARLGLSEALLGLVAALAANSPEITSAVTAVARGQREIGAGVVLGSNVFNLAALLGVGAVVAGRIDLHRRVVVLAGGVALWIAFVAVGSVGSSLGVDGGLALALVVFIPYVIVSGWWRAVAGRLRVPGRLRRWIGGAIEEEELELIPAILPTRGRPVDVVVAVLAGAVVVGGSIAMEHTASSLGTRLSVSPAIVGAVVLAAVTSLPNAVAAVYLAVRGRGAAAFSEALNSNNLNVMAGLLLPAALVGLGHPGRASTVTAWFALGLTALVLGLAYRSRGLRRAEGALIIAGYGVFLGVVLALGPGA